MGPAAQFLVSINWIRARNGKGAVPAHVYSGNASAAPPAFCKCATTTAILNGAAAMETGYCSPHVDSNGNHRNFFKLVGFPVEQARQEISLMEAILASYRLNMAAIRRP